MRGIAREFRMSSVPGLNARQRTANPFIVDIGFGVEEVEQVSGVMNLDRVAY
jgi:hypothetical protein